MGVLVVNMRSMETHGFCAALCSIQSLGRWRGYAGGSINRKETR